MSDTPRTDGEIIWHDDSDYVHASFARELLRENASLKADKEHLVQQLREANRLLIAWGPESARAAIDAARKEQP